MTDITELAQSKSLRKKLNRRLNDAYGFQRTSGGKHTTISLSIDECKSIIAAMDDCLALVEALEKAQQYAKERDEENQDLMLTIGRLRVEREGLESRTVKLPEPFELAGLSGGSSYYYADEVDAALTAQGIKVEAE